MISQTWTLRSKENHSFEALDDIYKVPLGENINHIQADLFSREKYPMVIIFLGDLLFKNRLPWGGWRSAERMHFHKI